MENYGGKACEEICANLIPQVFLTQSSLPVSIHVPSGDVGYYSAGLGANGVLGSNPSEAHHINTLPVPELTVKASYIELLSLLYLSI